MGLNFCHVSRKIQALSSKATSLIRPLISANNFQQHKGLFWFVTTQTNLNSGRISRWRGTWNFPFEDGCQAPVSTKSLFLSSASCLIPSKLFRKFKQAASYRKSTSFASVSLSVSYVFNSFMCTHTSLIIQSLWTPRFGFKWSLPAIEQVLYVLN